MAQRDTTVREEIEALRNRIRESGALLDPFELPGTSLEQYFADVYYEASRGDGELLAAYAALVRLYNTVICKTTNWLSDTTVGALDRVLRRELETAGDELTIITFNQDLVIENSLWRIKRCRSRCLEHLYGSPPAVEWLTSNRNARFPRHSEACEASPNVKLLKLHGSLNWGVRSRERAPARATLFPPANRNIFVHNGGQIGAGGTLTTGVGEGRHRWYWWPFVIPPIYDKGRMAENRVIRHVWQAASESIRTAERLVVIGYSLPEADVMARQMIRQAVFANERLEMLSCVDPSPVVVQKFQEKLNCSHIAYFRDVGAFLEHTNQ